MNEPVRTHRAVLESCLVPGNPLGDLCRREKIAEDVLKVLPEDVFQTLSDIMDDFIWFIPRVGMLGGVFPFLVNDPEPRSVVAGLRLAESD